MYRIRMLVPGSRLPPGEVLRDFPLLVVVRKQCLRSAARQGHVAHDDGRDFRFVAEANGAPLDFEIEAYDPAQGALTAWVRLPLLIGGTDLFFHLLYGAPAASAPARQYRVWDRHFQAVLHFEHAGIPARDSTALRHDAATRAGGTRAAPGIVHAAAALEGAALCLRASGDLRLGGACTVEAWVNPTPPVPDRAQAVAACWAVSAEPPALRIHDAARTSDLDVAGFLGAVFDGRYVYFAPRHDRVRHHGKVLRYDTHGEFEHPESWQAYDAGATAGLDTRGYCGAVCDGAYVYFVPRNDDARCHARVLRYDTRLPFQSAQSWDAYDAGHDFACQGGGFDGRHLYFAPGADNQGGQSGCITRHDTRAPFKNADAWETFDAARAFGDSLRDFSGMAFDGRYVYFVPRRFNVVLRFDAAGKFDQPESWDVYDAGRLGMRQCVGAVFDGRHVYFVPCDNSILVRCDVQRCFTAADAWSAHDLRDVPGLTAWGYAGGFFDGRCVYFIPFFGRDREQHPVFHSQLVRFDTSRDFNAPAAWQVTDFASVNGLPATGYNAGAFDGRCFYFAPWHDGKVFMAEHRIEGHARVLCCDTLAPGSAFVLKCSDYGHNGGLSGSIIGPAFTINTDAGHFTARLPAPLANGWRHLAGVYDGHALKLFVDGRLAAEQPARGRLPVGDIPVTLGGLADGAMALRGMLDEVRISNTARAANWLRLGYENQRAPESFCVAESEEFLPARAAQAQDAPPPGN